MTRTKRDPDDPDDPTRLQRCLNWLLSLKDGVYLFIYLVEMLFNLYWNSNIGCLIVRMSFNIYQIDLWKVLQIFAIFKPCMHPQPVFGRLWECTWFTEIVFWKVYVCLCGCTFVCLSVNMWAKFYILKGSL